MNISIKLNAVPARAASLLTHWRRHFPLFADTTVEGTGNRVRFHLNRVTHGLLPALTGAGVQTRQIGPSVHRVESFGARLTYFAVAGTDGILHGGSTPWQNLNTVITAQGLNDKQKVTAIRQVLARLPANVALKFNTSPHIPEINLVRRAFAEAGFSHSVIPTYTHKRALPVDAWDPIDEVGKNVRAQLKAARRDLEIVEIDTGRFMDFYAGNLRASGSASFFDLPAMRDILAEGMAATPPVGRIIAARWKPTPENPDPPLDGAIACTWGDDGYYKLSRMTHRHAAPGDLAQPHPHASKMLIAEAMLEADRRNLILDSDGATPGTVTLYRRFGNMQQAQREHFTCLTFSQRLNKAYPSVFPPTPRRLAARALRMLGK